VIYERLKNDPATAQLRADTLETLTKFAAEGLRTLVLGKVELDQVAYNSWAKKYHDASTALTDRAKKMALVAEEIEKNLELVGTTAIEDKLQAGVPATIELLSTAGIKIWVLTGDKQETAINIGFACALLHNEMGLFMFDECNETNVVQVLAAYVSDAKLVTDQDLGLVIQGNMLEAIVPAGGDGKSRECELFLSLATRCKAVICCRVSPLQKATVVSLVKGNMKTVTLAIGDGANDVSMIQAAHVGIGISGLEGLQAARASDYSIAQFRFLTFLLLIHGRFNYRRVSKLILYCFYKNMILFLTQFWFAALNRFTGQSLYDPWALSLYNLWFTAYPIVVLAVLDKDVKNERVLSKDQFPELYHDGMKSLIFNTTAFWTYTLNAILQSLTGFFICAYSCQFLEVPGAGQSLGMDGTGIVTFTTMLFIATFKLCLETQYWTIMNAVIVIVSAGMWFVFLGIYGNLYAWLGWSAFYRWYAGPAMALAHPLYWACCALAIITMLLRDVTWKAWRHNYAQKLGHIVQDFESQNAGDERRSFSRRDVLRCAPHLLPKFQALNPYQPHSEVTGAFFETEMQIPSLKSLRSRAVSIKKTLLDDESRSNTAKVSRAPMTGAYFAQPGKVKIKSIVMDDL
jgi:phospholipid-translocating P-type ATPase (flippase)